MDIVNCGAQYITMIAMGSFDNQVLGVNSIVSRSDDVPDAARLVMNSRFCSCVLLSANNIAVATPSKIDVSTSMRIESNGLDRNKNSSFAYNIMKMLACEYNTNTSRLHI